MIKELKWDSAFFRKKIGEIVIASPKPSRIKEILREIERGEFDYLTCKIRSHNASLNRLLESAGFYLTDIGVTLAAKTGAFLQRNLSGDLIIGGSIREAGCRDIPMLKSMSKSLFTESRYYSDPFFSKKEADRLYQIWVENSVKGRAADITYCIPMKGFITCRKSAGNKGAIILIGIKKDCRGKGLGAALVGEAMKWFMRQEVTLVTVRTQLKNLDALNFYLRQGFLIKEYDIVFAKIL